jgi:chemotaxis protein MotA
MAKPKTHHDDSSLFLPTISRTRLAITKTAAGAGVLGLVGFLALVVVAAVFFVTENYFIAMVIMSFALLVYVTGAELAKLLLTSFTIFFSSKHVIAHAAYLQDTLVALRNVLLIRRDVEGNLRAGPIKKGTVVKLPDNPLVRDIQTLLEHNPDYEYAEYIAHAYYVQCHEVYDHASAHLEFVATAMPLFGLIATIIGLIGMFESLGAEVTVEYLSPQLALALKTTLYGALLASVYKIIASRFDQRLKALDYDFDTFCRGLQVLKS